MCCLYLPSSSRRPGSNPAKRPEERTDELCSDGHISLDPLIASPIFIIAIVALRGHERTAVSRHFSSGSTHEDSLWG